MRESACDRECVRHLEAASKDRTSFFQVCVCVCERERESVCVCVSVRERDSV